MAEPSIPSVLGDYKILRLLGEGLMGRVYVGKKEGSNTIQGLKVLEKERAKATAVAWEFEGGDVRDPNLVHYKEITYGKDNQLILVFDVLKVDPLSKKALQSPRARKVVEFFLEATSSLAKIHSQGMAHGNLKPSNFMVASGGEALHPYISDIGLDYIYHPENFSGKNFLATFPYMAPEKIKSYFDDSQEERKATAQEDIYSLGVLLMEVLSGRRMFLGVSSVEVLLEKKQQDRSYHRLVGTTYHKFQVNLNNLNEILRGCIAPQPEDRPSMGELQKGLQASLVAEKKGA